MMLWSMSRVGWFQAPVDVALALVVVILVGCEDGGGQSAVTALPDPSCSQGAVDDDGCASAGPQGERLCHPEAPRCVPEQQCPTSGERFEGVCKPASPTFEDWLCPEGWRSHSFPEDFYPSGEAPPGATAFSVCRPEMVEPPTQCPVGSMPLPGQAQCIAQGASCPEEGQLWHSEQALRDLLPEPFKGSTIFYVSPSGSPDGDGSREAPFPAFHEPRLQRALRQNAESDQGAVVALSTGDHAGPLVIESRSVAVIGGCVERTKLVASPSPDHSATLRLVGVGHKWTGHLTVTGPKPGVLIGLSTREGSNNLFGVRVEGALAEAIRVTEGARAHLERVVVLDTTPLFNNTGSALTADNGAAVRVFESAFLRSHSSGVAVLHPGTHAFLSDVLVAHTRANNEGEKGMGLLVDDGASVVVKRASFLNNLHYGAVGRGGASLDLSDVVIAHTQPQAIDRSLGIGLALQGESSAEAARVIIHNNHGAGIQVDGGQLTLADAVITDTKASVVNPETGGQSGRGLDVVAGAKVVLERVQVSGNLDAGLSVFDEGTLLEATKLLVAQTQPNTNDLFGNGAIVAFGGVLKASELTFFKNNHTGVFVAFGGEANVEEAQIFDTGPRLRSSTLGEGIVVAAGGSLRLSRARVNRNMTVGISLYGEGSRGDLSDVEIAHTQPQESDKRAGFGMVVFEGATASGQRMVLSHNHSSAVSVSDGGSSLDLTDVFIASTQPQASDGRLGRGASVEKGATLELERAVVVQCRDGGVVLLGGGDTQSVLNAWDLRVTGTMPRFSDGLQGRGLNVQGGSRAQVTRGIIEDSHDFGVLALMEGSEVVLRDVLVDGVAQVSVEDCSEAEGIGVAGVHNATVEMEDFWVTRCQCMGAWNALSSQLTTTNGAVTGNARIGVFNADVDERWVRTNVHIEDNGQDIINTSPTVPQGAEAIPAYERPGELERYMTP